MPQLVVNMRVTVKNKIIRNLKNIRIKMQHALYSNRCVLNGYDKGT